jgi:predicted transglutaminase-like cysteine proteinase
MLWMAMFHPRLRSFCLWRNQPTAIAWIAAIAAINAMPSQVTAQSITHSANIPPFQNCGSQPAGLPVQMAMAPLGNVEPSAGPRSASKAEAILGGQMSKLEQMRLAQASDHAAAASAGPNIQSPGSDRFRDDCDDAGELPLQPTTVRQIDVSANAILGSMSIAIARTPFDLKWAAVNSKRGRGKFDRLLTATGARHSDNQSGQVEAINRWVNRNIQFGEDREIYGRSDYWATAGETFRRGIGDCEDFAIAKMELLSALGISRDKMRLIVARDLVRNADHAVLVVTLADGAVMLDNMTDRLLDARLPNDYRPIMSFSQNTKWVHGYSVQSAQPVRMASANDVPSPAGVNLGDVLTVTVEPEMPVFSMALLSVPLVLPSGLSARA